MSAAVYRAEMDRQMNLDSLRIESQLNDPFKRNGPVSDSSLQEIKKVIAVPQDIQAIQVNLGQGLDWWMTRLYFLASLAADLASIEVMVFVGEADSFIGIANPRIVKERLAQLHPLLKKYEDALQQSGPPLPGLVNEVERRANLWDQEMSDERTTPVFVSRRELESWLSPYLIRQALDWEPNGSMVFRIQRLIDWPMRFVPIVEKDRFTRVVDKQSITEQVARLFVREQVARALSMTR